MDTKDKELVGLRRVDTYGVLGDRPGERIAGYFQVGIDFDIPVFPSHINKLTGHQIRMFPQQDCVGIHLPHGRFYGFQVTVEGDAGSTHIGVVMFGTETEAGFDRLVKEHR
jgi:hypothetical protein